MTKVFVNMSFIFIDILMPKCAKKVISVSFCCFTTALLQYCSGRLPCFGDNP